MAKKLLHDYTFDASAKQVVLQGVYKRERLLMISNVTDNVIIFVFNQTAFSLTAFSNDLDAQTTTLTFNYDTTSMSDTDVLQIFIEDDSVPIAPAETYVDPVSKLRVSNPENLIDTDFEYGLQSTKWETLELVKNIPTFYSRNGDESLDLTSVTKTNASEIISVTTAEAHNLSIGNPIIVQGTDSISADGAFIVTAIPSSTSFQYKAKSVQSGSASILDTYTQIFVGSVYQGTEFQLSALNSITTDAANPSVLSVETADPTNFSLGTSFFLSNSLGSKSISVNAANVEPNNARTKRETFTHMTATSFGDKSKWAIGPINPYNWTPKRGMFVIIGGQADSDVNFNTTTNEIEFDEDHVFADGEAAYWVTGYGNSVPGGLSERPYWVRVVDSKKIYLTIGGPTGLNKVNLTGQGANAGHIRSCLMYGLFASSVNTTSEVWTFDQNFTNANGAHPPGCDANTPYRPFYTTIGGLNYSSSPSTYFMYYFEGDATPYSYYLAPESGTQNQAKFLLSVGGATANATSATVNGIIVPMEEQSKSDGNSYYLPRGGWANLDTVFYNSTSIPGGFTNNGFYQLVACDSAYPDRFRLQGINRYPNNSDVVNMTNYGGTTNNISTIFKTQNTLRTTATGETGGWALGSPQPKNWLPEDAFFFVPGTAPNSTIGVDTSANTIQFSSAHGLVDDQPYVYFRGYGNGNIGGLTDSRWYYVRVVDATKIYLTLTQGSTTKVNLTSAGTAAGISRACFVKGYRATGSANTAEDTITFIDNPNLTAGADQLLMACYTTFGGLTVFSSSDMIMSYEIGGGQVVYPKTVSPDGLTISFTDQLGGSTKQLSGAVSNGIMIRVRRAPDANSIYFPNHGLETGDQVYHTSNSSSISGLSNGNKWQVHKIDNNRIRFQYPDYTYTQNFGNYGNGAATTYDMIIPFTNVDSGDYIHATNHGLNNGDAVTYNANGGDLIHPLVDGTTYYVQNATTDKFQLSTVAEELSGNAIDVLQNTSYITGNGFYWYMIGHPFNTGDRVKYTSASPVSPFKSGAYYYVYKHNANYIILHLSYDSCLINDYYGQQLSSKPFSGTGTFQKTNVVDLATKGSGTQIFNATTPGSTDGVYKIDNIVNDTSFSFTANSQIQNRIVNFTPNSSVWIEQDAIRIPDHNFVTGQDVAYSHGTTGTVVTFTVTIVGGKYHIDGVQQPTLELKEGHKYIFDQSDSSNTNHPLRFSLTDDGTHQSGTEYTTGVTYTGQPGTDGKTEIVVATGVATLYYYCGNHAGMGSQANTPSIATIVVGGLTTRTTYFVIRISRNWIKLAASLADANAGTHIPLTAQGDGLQVLETNSLVGEVIGGGTVSADQDSFEVTGTNTNFTSFFNTGDTISIYATPGRETAYVSSINTNTSVFTTSPAHGFDTGDMVIMDATQAPPGTVNGRFYYIKKVANTTFTLHPTLVDATNGTNTVAVTDVGNTVNVYKLTDIGATYTNTVKAVTGIGSLQLQNAQAATVSDGDFTIGTSLLMRADGFAIHRPYDGGVELIPSKNPDSRMIRQTRRYFRYQSGKGIQVSFAVNFSPSIQIDSYTSVGTTATIKTRHPHRLVTGLTVVITGAKEVSGQTNYWNGTFAVQSIVDEYTYTITLTGTPHSASSGPIGIPEFYLQGWTGSNLRCGLYDDQNGLFFEYNGSVMSVCRRNATTQISGEGAVTFRSGTVTGVNTKFSKQLSLNDNIVIKGQTYVVTKISSDTNISILPTYRGTSNSGVVITKIMTTKIPQTQWNLDKCDGTGPSGFNLNPARIQMAYMDYSWYGAGKVRFGFKDNHGKVFYVHEFIHNNVFREAYLRSGNVPARYEIENEGTPSFVPALAHWGTSVIMDGGFDPDNAYQFTASSQDIQITGANTITVGANAEYLYDYHLFWNNQWRNIGRALQIQTPSFLYNSIPNNVPITGANLGSNVRTRNPNTYYGLPAQPYQVNLRTRTQWYNSSTEEFRNLLLINQQPTGTTNTNSNYTVTASTTGVPVVYDVPLISIRLAPSVDTNTPGFLGEREIVNRMQLILRSVGILSTHNCTVTLRLNALITNTDWSRVENPSLSQLIYHSNQDQISGGLDIFNFRAQGGTGSSGRSAVVTTQELAGVTTLGNSILGGNNVFPDGPDVLTIVARLNEDPSTVSQSNPFNVTGRISWTESQA